MYWPYQVHLRLLHGWSSRVCSSDKVQSVAICILRINKTSVIRSISQNGISVSMLGVISTLIWLRFKTMASDLIRWALGHPWGSVVELVTRNSSVLCGLYISFMLKSSDKESSANWNQILGQCSLWRKVALCFLCSISKPGFSWIDTSDRSMRNAGNFFEFHFFFACTELHWFKATF